MTADYRADFSASMSCLGFAPGARVAVAVSGGGDSMALALLLKNWGADIVAFTVDHGLRPGSAKEAVQVHDILTAHGIAHHILRWRGDKPQTHIQERARAVRYDLLLQACRDHGCTALALGHNLEDQMETFWMRLAAGSGVDGLAAMASVRVVEGISIIRPVLSFARADLRRVCDDAGIAWLDDPSNENEKFLRVRLRGFEGLLADEGLTGDRLARTVQKMASAKAALDFYADAAFQEAVQMRPQGYAVLDAQKLSAHPFETVRRVLQRALHSVYSQEYPPGHTALGNLVSGIVAPNFSGTTLAGCEIFPFQKRIVICREFGSCAPPVPATAGTVWDNRVSVTEDRPHCMIGALGEASPSEDWAGALEGVPFKARKSLPVYWRDGVPVEVAGLALPELEKNRTRKKA
ncbi:MAG: tRNA lysidine(34) synthetase TilS [Alphaproteobacteria bacterium]|nr:tRNA lysidine(34) synthetase TilS [Alphaproteobacteria bacterium]